MAHCQISDSLPRLLVGDGRKADKTACSRALGIEGVRFSTAGSGSAKPLHAGSIPARASKLFLQLLDFTVCQLENGRSCQLGWRFADQTPRLHLTMGAGM